MEGGSCFSNRLRAIVRFYLPFRAKSLEVPQRLRACCPGHTCSVLAMRGSVRRERVHPSGMRTTTCFSGSGIPQGTRNLAARPAPQYAAQPATNHLAPSRSAPVRPATTKRPATAATRAPPSLSTGQLAGSRATFAGLSRPASAPVHRSSQPPYTRTAPIDHGRLIARLLSEAPPDLKRRARAGASARLGRPLQAWAAALCDGGCNPM